MSLESFQRAVVELTLAPSRARALRYGDDGVLNPYTLTGRERDRLVSIVHQSGMSVHCSLSRGNRLEIIAGEFPMTCVLLRPVLRALVDELWHEYRPTNYQLMGEQTAFAVMVGRKIAAGELNIEYLQEIFAYETACLELAQQVLDDPDAGAESIVEFQHSPDDLLPPLSRREAPPAKLPIGTYSARVSLREGQFKVEILSARA